MIYLTWSILRLSIRTRYPRALFFVVDAFATLADFLFYYFTAEAFGKVLGTENYFRYVVWGEVIAAVPLAALLTPARLARAAHIDGTWEIFLTHPLPVERILAKLASQDLLHAVLRILMIGTLAAALGTFFEAADIARAVLLVMLALPLFWFLGILALGGLLLLGRGFQAFQQLGYLGAVLAGVYFPLAVFPSWLQTLSRGISPLTLLLEATRGGHTLWPAAVLTGLATAGALTVSRIFLWVRRRIARKGNRFLPR